MCVIIVVLGNSSV